MKFIWSMIGFILLVMGAFYLGYQSDLGPVDSDVSTGFSQKEAPVGGIRGGTTSSSGISSSKGSSGGAVRKCLDGARCY
jgi:hypothetical protein